MTNVAVGSYWADNKAWRLGRVVQIVAVDATHAVYEITKDEDVVSCGYSLPRTTNVGRRYRTKLDNFRGFDRPRHGGWLPASGPGDGRTSILTHAMVHPVERRGMAHSTLLQLKYASGWTVKAAETGEVVDFAPRRRKGDGRAWRAPDGTRYPSTKCKAAFPPGMRMMFGATTETTATTFPTSDWFTVAHVLVSPDHWTAACGVETTRLVFPSDALGLTPDLDAAAVMCDDCEAESPDAVMACQVQTRLRDFGVETAAADGAFDTTELDQL